MHTSKNSVPSITYSDLFEVSDDENSKARKIRFMNLFNNQDTSTTTIRKNINNMNSEFFRYYNNICRQNSCEKIIQKLKSENAYAIKLLKMKQQINELNELAYQGSTTSTTSLLSNIENSLKDADGIFRLLNQFVSLINIFNSLKTSRSNLSIANINTTFKNFDEIKRLYQDNPTLLNIFNRYYPNTTDVNSLIRRFENSKNNMLTNETNTYFIFNPNNNVFLYRISNTYYVKELVEDILIKVNIYFYKYSNIPQIQIQIDNPSTFFGGGENEANNEEETNNLNFEIEQEGGSYGYQFNQYNQFSNNNYNNQNYQLRNQNYNSLDQWKKPRNDFKPWQGQITILKENDTEINEYYLALVNSFTLNNWNSSHPAKTNSSFLIKGSSVVGGVEKGSGDIKVFESGIIGHVEDTRSFPYLNPPKETYAEIIAKEASNYSKLLAEINNALGSEQKINDTIYSKEESSWPPYFKNDLVILKITENLNKKKITEIYHLSDLVLNESTLKIRKQNGNLSEGFSKKSIANLKKGIIQLEDYYKNNRLWKYFPSKIGKTPDDPCISINSNVSEFNITNLNDSVGSIFDWLNNCVNQYHSNIAARIITSLMICSRFNRPSLLTKDFLSKSKDNLLKSHTDILALLTQLEEIESSAKRCWNDIEGDNKSKCQIKGIKSYPASSNGSLGMDGVMFPCVLQ